jgi:hypothetical protein
MSGLTIDETGLTGVHTEKITEQLRSFRVTAPDKRSQR